MPPEISTKLHRRCYIADGAASQGKTHSTIWKIHFNDLAHFMDQMVAAGNLHLIPVDIYVFVSYFVSVDCNQNAAFGFFAGTHCSRDSCCISWAARPIVTHVR